MTFARERIKGIVNLSEIGDRKANKMIVEAFEVRMRGSRKKQDLGWTREFSTIWDNLQLPVIDQGTIDDEIVRRLLNGETTVVGYTMCFVDTSHRMTIAKKGLLACLDKIETRGIAERNPFSTTDAKILVAFRVPR